MASSVENRVPFLDHNWIEFVRYEIPLNHLVCVFLLLTLEML